MIEAYAPALLKAAPGIAQGLFGNSGRPYEKAWDAAKPYYEQAQSMQNPFYQAGVNAINPYTSWLNNMSDPSGFMNNLMANYQQSPYARYQTDAANRSAMNMASASGLSGSSPLAQQMAQSSRDISSQDMNNWLSNVLGVNQMYGQGQAHLMGQGAHSADMLSQILSGMGQNAGQAAFGRAAGQNADRGALFGGLLSLFGG